MSRRARKRARRGARLQPSPAAFTLDGSAIANVALVDGADDPTSAIREASKIGGRVFVGIELRDVEAAELRRWLEDAAHEGLGFILGARLARRRRTRARKPKGAA
jgi:hypothetical protein